MTMKNTAAKHEVTHIVTAQGKPLVTPGKHALAVPSQALAQAISAEWDAHGKFSPAKMPLTTLAYTAIDRIAGNEAAIIEALLVYVDTDTLSYRATSSKILLAQQDEQWGAILAWADKTYGTTWLTTQGVMPVEQPKALTDAIEKRLHALDAFSLAALCIFSSGFSSLALALATLEGRVDAAEAFRLSRLEEEAQAEQWGRDEEASARAAKLQEEIVSAERFLSLLSEV